MRGRDHKREREREGESRLLDSARLAVRHAAKLLGRVTFCANNHTIQVVGDEGKHVNQTVRDSVDAPKHRRATHTASGRQAAKPLVKAEPAREVKPWTPPATSGSRRACSGPEARRVASLEEAQLLRRVQEVGARLRPSSQRPAAERLAELRQRVLGASSQGA